METELRGCPFCGGKPAVVRMEDEDGEFAVVSCQQCGCATLQHYFCGDDAVRQVVSAWNHRHSGGDGEAWRGIESAPRDGERIILGRPDLDGDGGGISVAGYWLEELEDGVDYMGNDGGFTDVDFQVFQPGRSFGAESYRYAGNQPTHWRPLPSPPTEEE